MENEFKKLKEDEEAVLKYNEVLERLKESPLNKFLNKEKKDEALDLNLNSSKVTGK